MTFITQLKDRRLGKLNKAQKRSDMWHNMRNAFLQLHPSCAACGTTEKLEVHHIIPVHVSPDMELAESNLITLCESNGNHHLWTGHLGDFHSWNINVREDSEILKRKIGDRP